MSLTWLVLSENAAVSNSGIICPRGNVYSPPLLFEPGSSENKGGEYTFPRGQMMPEFAAFALRARVLRKLPGQRGEILAFSGALEDFLHLLLLLFLLLLA